MTRAAYISAPGLSPGADRPGAMRGYRRARQRQAWSAVLLAGPLLIFLTIIFFLPIGTLLYRSIEGLGVGDALPRTAAGLRHWSGPDLPDEAVFAALGADLREAAGTPTLGTTARLLNAFEPGFRSLLFKTSRRVGAEPPESWKAFLLSIDPQWGDPATWTQLRLGTAPVTGGYLLAALDAKLDGAGHVVHAPAEERVYLPAFGRTLLVSGIVTALTFLLGYPVAYLLATLPERAGNRLMIFVIIPFWTSLLVRTTAWYVLLQPNGVVNTALRSLGLSDTGLPLIFNRTGVLIGMTHILLPYMILANYAVMKGISPSFMRAALSLGAHPVVAFVRVYVPLTLPGIAAGTFLVFVLALGYYITPAMLGGGADAMISQFIAFQVQNQLNWGLAGALSLYLVALTTLLYVVFNRLVGVERLRLG